MANKDTSMQTSFIEAVKTPLGFFSLIVLVIEGALVGLALAVTGPDRTFLVYAIPALLAFMLLVIMLVAVFRPEALWGKRYDLLEESFAREVGVDVDRAFSGALDNLDTPSRLDAYRFLHTMFFPLPKYASSRTKKKFCKEFIGAIERHSGLSERDLEVDEAVPERKPVKSI